MALLELRGTGNLEVITTSEERSIGDRATRRQLSRLHARTLNPDSDSDHWAMKHPSQQQNQVFQAKSGQLQVNSRVFQLK